MAARLSKVKLPQFQPGRSASSAGIVLFAALGYWFFSRQSLERSQESRESLRQERHETSHRSCRPGDGDGYDQWYNDIYKQYKDLKLALGGQEAGVTIQPVGEATGGRRRQVNVLFSKEGDAFRRLDFQRQRSAEPEPGQRQANRSRSLSSGRRTCGETGCSTERRRLPASGRRG